MGPSVLLVSRAGLFGVGVGCGCGTWGLLVGGGCSDTLLGPEGSGSSASVAAVGWRLRWWGVGFSGCLLLCLLLAVWLGVGVGGVVV